MIDVTDVGPAAGEPVTGWINDMATDKNSLSYRAGFQAYRDGRALADDPGQLFENWAEYQIGYIDACADACRAVESMVSRLVK